MSKDYKMNVSNVEGITLRDWFAGMIINAMIINEGTPTKEDDFDVVAYAIADDMVSQSNQNGGE
jgi:predicted nuclease of predicted toxin-antitoxin system